MKDADLVREDLRLISEEMLWVRMEIERLEISARSLRRTVWLVLAMSLLVFFAAVGVVIGPVVAGG